MLSNAARARAARARPSTFLIGSAQRSLCVTTGPRIINPDNEPKERMRPSSKRRARDASWQIRRAFRDAGRQRNIARARAAVAPASCNSAPSKAYRRKGALKHVPKRARARVCQKHTSDIEADVCMAQVSTADVHNT